MNRMELNHYINRAAFWILVFAIALFTMTPFAYAISISFRTNQQVLIEAKYLPESENFEEQFNLDGLQIVDVVNPGVPGEEYVELQNMGPRTINLEGWRINSDSDYELQAISLAYDSQETPPQESYPQLDEVRDRNLRLRGVSILNDVQRTFQVRMRAFPNEDFTLPETAIIGANTLDRSYDRLGWQSLNNLRYSFDVGVVYFTRYVLPEISVESGETLRIYSHSGSNSDDALYMGLEPGEYNGETVFDGTLWSEEDTVVSIANDTGIRISTFNVGAPRILQTQVVDSFDLGNLNYVSFADFFVKEVLSGENLNVFLDQFGGRSLDSADFGGITSMTGLEDALEGYADQNEDFDLEAAMAFVDSLEETSTPDAFRSVMADAGLDTMSEALVARATAIRGERVIVRNATDQPENIAGWEISNSQQNTVQEEIPAVSGGDDDAQTIVPPNGELAIVTGYGLNTEAAIFLNQDESIWEDGNIANLTNPNAAYNSRHIIGGEVYAFRNYTNLIEDETFLQNLFNSAIVATVTVTLSLVIGSFAAYALGRVRFRGQYIILYLVLAMTMFPQISILSGMFKLVNDLDLYNSNLAMIFSYPIFTLPFTVWVLTSFFQGLPAEIEQAALVDGANAFQTFWRILVPLTAPALVTTGLLAFIQAWNEYLFALTFTLGEAQQTVPVAIANFAGFDREEAIADKIAAAVVVTVPLIVLVLIFQRRIVEGLTAGAVKG